MELGRRPAPHLRRRSAKFKIGAENVRALIHPDDWSRAQADCRAAWPKATRTSRPNFACCVRTARSAGASAPRRRASMPPARWCVSPASPSTSPIARRPKSARCLLAREVDHRARNALAVIQSIIRLTRAKSVDDYVLAIEGRIKAMARAHTLLSDSRWHGADLGTLVAEELAPYRAGDKIEIGGPDISLQPATAQGSRACAARTRHQRRQARRAVVACRQGQARLAIAGGRT